LGTLSVALVEAGQLTPERDAGARADADLLDGLDRLGHSPRLVVEADGDLAGQIERFGPDVVVCSRPAVMLRHAGYLRTLGVPLVYLGHDLHHRRLAEQHRVEGTPPAAAGRIMRSVEERCWEAADWSAYPDAQEADEVAAHVGPGRAGYFPYYLIEPLPAAPDRPPGPHGAADPERLFFVGGGRHGPNRDGIAWFLAQVWPGVVAARPAAHLTVCGGWHPTELPAGLPHGVEFTGPLPEAGMLGAMADSGVAVAPLRYGAGVKRKVLQYLAGGVATVTTGVGAQGIWSPHDGGPAPFVVADGAANWVRALLGVMGDGELRSRLVAGGCSLITERYSAPVYLEALSGLLADVRAAHGRRAGAEPATTSSIEPEGQE